MDRDFHQIEWDRAVEEDCRQLVRLAVREDLERSLDWTTVSLVGEDCLGEATVVARHAGVIAGLPAAQLALDEMDERLRWTAVCHDGTLVAAGQAVARIAGPARSLLAAERLALNLIGHLSGIATLTAEYVRRVAATKARIYDTRKTTPGWRRLEKYAVRAGGGHNHRTGLFDAVLIKDNHLALGAAGQSGTRFTPAEAVTKARQFLAQMHAEFGSQNAMIVEVEVDTLAQLAEVLPAAPDIVLLDNMPPAQLAQAVQLRDRMAPAIELEASGGVNLDTVTGIAESGVDRISVGALTHSARWFDVGLDWS